jgi:hypothetical protein
MDKRRTAWSAIFWIICLFLLILDSKTVILGATEGLDLCIRVLIPSMFPFLVVCPMISSRIGTYISIFRPFGRLLRLPEGAEDLFFLGLLSGYPVGAAMVSQAAQSGRISKQDAMRYLSFCSNAGPSFIFGIGAGLFPGIGYCAVLWLIQIISAAIVGILTPGKSPKAGRKHQTPLSLQQALRNAVSTMAIICGWVILFRVLITVLERWMLWFLPVSAQIVVRGVLELANGIVSLSQIGNLGLRMIIFSTLLSFGGICVWMQTRSVVRDLSMRYYLPGKLTQCAISYMIATALQFFLPSQQRYIPHPALLAICAGICVAYPIFLQKSENSSRNSCLVGV